MPKGEYRLDLLKTHRDLQESILRDITRRILKTDMTVTETAAWQAEKLQQSGVLYRDILTEVGKRTGEIEYEIKAIFRDAETDVLNYDDGALQTAGIDPKEFSKLSPAMRKTIDAALAKTSTEAINLTKTTAITAQNRYIQACDLAHMQVASGTFSYQDAIKNAIMSAAYQGVHVVYPSGWISPLDVAIWRSTLTGVNQTAGQLQVNHANQYNVDLMEITAHIGARPEHAAWQGRIVSRSGREGYLSLADIGYGDVRGFMGANCRHNWFMFFEGASQRTYTDAKLDEMADAKVTYNRREYLEYEAKQVQRGMERGIRQAKQKLVMLDEAIKNGKTEFQTDFNFAAVKLKRQEATLRDFCGQTDFREDTFRTQMFSVKTEKGLKNFGRSTSSKAVWAEKRALTKGSGKPIIDEKLCPKKIAGVKRGKPMSRDDANHGKPNPNFEQSFGYMENCQSCVVAYEARLRGFDVQALPYINNSKFEKLSMHTNMAWIDPATGNYPDYIYDDTATTAKKFYRFIEKTVEIDKRYTLEFAWKGRSNSGHIISIDRGAEGLLRLYDPQDGRTYEGGAVKRFLDELKYTTTVRGTKMPTSPKVLRIDDKGFNLNMVNYILEGVRQ